MTSLYVSIGLEKKSIRVFKSKLEALFQPTRVTGNLEITQNHK